MARKQLLIHSVAGLSLIGLVALSIPFVQSLYPSKKGLTPICPESI